MSIGPPAIIAGSECWYESMESLETQKLDPLAHGGSVLDIERRFQRSDRLCRENSVRLSGVEWHQCVSGWTFVLRR